MQSKAFAFLTGRFFDGISSGMFMMALPWLMLKNGASGVVVAMTALGCTVGSFVFTPWLATLIDRHSRKAILVCVQLIQVLTALTVLLGYWFQADSLELLIAAQMTFWWSGDLAWSANSAFTQENFESDEYPEISGRLEVVMQTTSLGSGAAGIFLLSYWSMIEFSLFAALASMIAAFCYMIMPYRRLIRINQSVPFLGQLVDTKNIFGRQPAFFWFLALSCLSYPTLTFLAKLIPIYFSEQEIAGDWFAAWKVSYGFGALICGLFVARLLTRYSSEKAMIYSVLSLSMLLMLMFTTLNPIILIVLTIPFGFLNSYNRIARTVKMSRQVATEERGRIDGGLKLFSTLCQSLGYVLIAWLSHRQLTEVGFVISALVLCFAALAMGLLYRQRAHLPMLAI